MKEEEKFQELMQEYNKDLEQFGFGGYCIDFSDVKIEDTESLCYFIRSRNQGYTDGTHKAGVNKMMNDIKKVNKYE